MKPRRIYRNVVTASLLAMTIGLGGCVVGASSYYPTTGSLENDYWYYPSVGVYYDNQQGYYHYNSGGTWVQTTVLPPYLYSSLGTYVVLNNPGPRPWYYYNYHRNYYPPERYRHYAPNPPPPRYGPKPRWDDDQRPVNRPPPSGGQTPPGYYRPGGDDTRPGYRPPGNNRYWLGSSPPGGDRPPPGQGPRTQPIRFGDDPGSNYVAHPSELPHGLVPDQVHSSRPVGNRPSPQPKPWSGPPSRNDQNRIPPGGSPSGPYTPPPQRPSGNIPVGKPGIPPSNPGDNSSGPVSGPFGGQTQSSGSNPHSRPGPLAEY